MHNKDDIYIYLFVHIILPPEILFLLIKYDIPYLIINEVDRHAIYITRELWDTYVQIWPINQRERDRLRELVVEVGIKFDLFILL